MSASGYQLLLTSEALRFLLRLRAEERRQLDHLFERLTNLPFTPGDYQEHTAEGAAVEVLLRGRFVVTFRADHAARELRLLRVERA